MTSSRTIAAFALASLLAACGQNQPLTDTKPPTTKPPTTEQRTSVSPAPASRAKARQFVHDGFTYEVTPYKVHRLINNVPPGYALPIPSFRLDMVNPTDRGTTLFIDFTGHFRTAYRKSALTDARPFVGASFTISSCQDVPDLPEFCSFNLFDTDGKTLREDRYQTIFADAAGNGIDGWITSRKPIYLQFSRSNFALRDGYRSSDFALLHLAFERGRDPVIDDVIIAQG